MPNTVLEISDLAFSSCNNLTSIIFSNKLNRIRDAVFIHCKGLTSINLPRSITSIGYSAFNDCANLISINIPNSVTYLGNTTFWDCINLKSIHAQSTEPVELDNERYNTFFGVPLNSCILYVPKGSKTKYENTPQWWDFKNIVEEDNTTGIQTVTANELGISVIDGKAIISNLTVGEMVQIYTLDGKIVFSNKATKATLDIQLPCNKLYIVNIGTKCAKIILR